MGIFSAIGGFLGASAVKKAAKNQKKTAEAEKAAITSAYAPWMESGTGALDSLNTAYGIGDNLDARRAALQSGWESSGLYQNVYQPALEKSTNAFQGVMGGKGALRSGATLKGLQDRAGQLSNSYYGQYLSGLGNLSSQGLGATGTAFGLRSGQTQNVINAQGAKGAATAAGWMGLGNALDSGVNTLAQAYGYGSGGQNPWSSYSQPKW